MRGPAQFGGERRASFAPNVAAAQLKQQHYQTQSDISVASDQKIPGHLRKKTMHPVPYEKDELKASYSQDQTDPEDNH